VRLDRRHFVGLGLGAAAGSALGIPAGRLFSQILSSADNSIYPPRGTEGFCLSVCSMCPGGCGLRVRKIGSRAIKLDGNPLHPVNAGRLCPKGQAGLQSLYHPDRTPGPLHRVGPRGSLASFEKVSWERALEEIGGKLRTIREEGRPESLVLLRRNGTDIGTRLARRFAEAFGSPNDVLLDRGDEAAAIALHLGQGVRATPVYDLPSADYVLSLGGALLEAWNSPVHTMRAYGAFRQARTGRRGKLVQVEPRLSGTGASADEWIAVRPGTEAAFGFGIAAVLLAEGLYDKEFVAEKTMGLEDGHEAGGLVRPGLRSVLEKNFPLEQVAAETGVSVNVILRIAREFAAARRSLAVGSRQGPLLPGRLSEHLAAHTLNALVGNLDQPGGLLVADDVPLAPWPVISANAVTASGRRRPRLDKAGTGDFPLLASDPEQLAEAILAGTPYRAEAMLILGADPLLTSTAGDRFAAAVEKVPLVVSFATLPDDTSLHADWILPEAHSLERWDMQTTPPGVPYPAVSLSRPALDKPLRDVRPAAEIFLDLARRVGLENALPWKDVPTLLRAEMDGLYRARRGALMGTPFDEAWIRMMEGAGWWVPGYRSSDELWKKAQDSGGWWDPFYDHGDWKRVVRTPSGRFEFRADVVSRLVVTSDEPVPLAEPSQPPGSLRLILFEPLSISGGTGAELPFLQGLLDAGEEERWETWAEIHPESAAALGVKDRDWIRISSQRGSIDARARVGHRVVAGAVAVPVGLGKAAGGRWAKGIGSNPLRLLSNARDRSSGLPDFGATTVRVARVSGPERASSSERRA
jgi:menaquinone reductase, molybdopterin-binding-like subunit